MVRIFPKPEVVVSGCLGFQNCRYNAQTVPNKFVKRLGEFVNYTTVCPEVEIGLGVPREPVRLVGHNRMLSLIQPATGLDCTEKMETFGRSFLNSLERVDGFILKSLSPSCGVKDVKVYPSTKKGPAVGKGRGLFGEAVFSSFGHLPIEDEGRLTNFIIREHFLTSLFTIARFEDFRKGGEMKDLIQFQSDNKLLFMAYNQSKMRLMGQVAGNLEKKEVNTVFQEYSTLFYQLVATPPKPSSHTNVLLHGLGYFSRYLSAGEKKFFLATLEKYRDGEVPLSVPLHILNSYVVAFENEYLSRQTFFEPYPRSLVDVTDSGRGRNFR